MTLRRIGSQIEDVRRCDAVRRATYGGGIYAPSPTCHPRSRSAGWSPMRTRDSCWQPGTPSRSPSPSLKSHHRVRRWVGRRACSDSRSRRRGPSSPRSARSRVLSARRSHLHIRGVTYTWQNELRGVSSIIRRLISGYIRARSFVPSTSRGVDSCPLRRRSGR